MYDVIVIGGGLSGLNCAYKFSKASLDVLVLDNQPRIGKGRVCTGVVNSLTFYNCLAKIKHAKAGI